MKLIKKTKKGVYFLIDEISMNKLSVNKLEHEYKKSLISYTKLLRIDSYFNYLFRIIAKYDYLEKNIKVQVADILKLYYEISTKILEDKISLTISNNMQENSNISFEWQEYHENYSQQFGYIAKSILSIINFDMEIKKIIGLSLYENPYQSPRAHSFVQQLAIIGYSLATQRIEDEKNNENYFGIEIINIEYDEELIIYLTPKGLMEAPELLLDISSNQGTEAMISEFYKHLNMIGAQKYDNSNELKEMYKTSNFLIFDNKIYYHYKQSCPNQFMEDRLNKPPLNSILKVAQANYRKVDNIFCIKNFTKEAGKVKIQYNINSFVFDIVFEMKDQINATIPLYFSETAYPSAKITRIDFLNQDLNSFFPEKIDSTGKNLEWKEEVYEKFFNLLDTHYRKYDRLSPSDAEYYVALLSLLQNSILQKISITTSLKTVIEDNRRLIEEIRNRFATPIEVDFDSGNNESQTHEKISNFDLIFSKFPILTTSNLILKSFTKNDASVLYKMFKDASFAKEFIPDDTEISYEVAYYTIFEFEKTFAQRKDISWAIAKKDTGEIIGRRDVFFDSPRDVVVTQGFFFKEYRNKGYNQEVLKALVEFLKKANSPALIFNCSSDNAPVRHIAEKLKFRDITTNAAFRQGRMKFILPL